MLTAQDPTSQDALVAYIYLKQASALDSDLAVPEGLMSIEEQLKESAEEQVCVCVGRVWMRGTS